MLKHQKLIGRILNQKSLMFMTNIGNLCSIKIPHDNLKCQSNNYNLISYLGIALTLLFGIDVPNNHL